MLPHVTSHTTYKSRYLSTIVEWKKYIPCSKTVASIRFLVADTLWSVGIPMLGHSGKIDIKHIIGLEAHIQRPKQCVPCSNAGPLMTVNTCEQSPRVNTNG